MDEFSTDVLIVGAGASGLVAAVAARKLGLEVTVVESDEQVGGTTATSRGLVWLPVNEAMRKVGEHDSAEEALEYLAASMGEPTRASSADRRTAYVRTAPALARWLRNSKVPLIPARGVGDYEMDLPGAKKQGRALEVQAIDRRVLGEWADRVRRPHDDPDLSPRSLRGLLTTSWYALNERINPKSSIATEGGALVCHLLNRAVATGVDIRTAQPLTRLLTEGDRVVGGVVSHEGAEVAITARQGVLLACGGFEQNAALRKEHLPQPSSTEWSLGAPGNQGTGLACAEQVGAAVAGLGDAWWRPVLVADGIAYSVDTVRTVPHGLVVDSAGDRFFNEASTPYLAGVSLYERNRGVAAIPSFLIVDQRHRKRYPMGPWLPGAAPARAVDDGDLARADSLNDLGQGLDIDLAGLIGTVVRFNGFAAKGRDQDFGRGDSPADRVRGDATSFKNPCLGKVEKAPLWAVRIYPGDEGTKGGIVTDEDARALRPDGSVIPGLYACAGAAASPVKGSPAPGMSLGSSLVEAFRAALAMAEQLPRLDEASV